MHRVRLRDWQPTELAGMLWLVVAAMLLGWVTVLVLGHPVDLTP